MLRLIGLALVLELTAVGISEQMGLYHGGIAIEGGIDIEEAIEVEGGIELDGDTEIKRGSSIKGRTDIANTRRLKRIMAR